VVAVGPIGTVVRATETAVADASGPTVADGSGVLGGVSVGTSVAGGTVVAVAIAATVGKRVADDAVVAVGGKAFWIAPCVDVGTTSIGCEAVLVGGGNHLTTVGRGGSECDGFSRDAAQGPKALGLDGTRLIAKPVARRSTSATFAGRS
jgi:hypothetical protein